MNERSWRVLRGMGASLVAVFAALMSHMAAGGPAPGPLGLALSLVFGTLVSIALIGKSASLWRLSLAVISSQVFLHALFSMGSPTALSAQQLGHHGPVSFSGATSALTTHAAHAEGWMLLAHAGAALATIVFLACGERTVWQIFRASTSRFLTALCPALDFAIGRAPSRTPRVSQEFTRPRRHHRGGVLTPLSHRGPPGYAFTV